jgi:predicted lysophospholipase L1 biosynthesis ABC-type transport system permease subunit
MRRKVLRAWQKLYTATALLSMVTLSIALLLRFWLDNFIAGAVMGMISCICVCVCAVAGGVRMYNKRH